MKLFCMCKRKKKYLSKIDSTKGRFAFEIALYALICLLFVRFWPWLIREKKIDSHWSLHAWIYAATTTGSINTTRYRYDHDLIYVERAREQNIYRILSNSWRICNVCIGVNWIFVYLIRIDQNPNGPRILSIYNLDKQSSTHIYIGMWSSKFNYILFLSPLDFVLFIGIMLLKWIHTANENCTSSNKQKEKTIGTVCKKHTNKCLECNTINVEKNPKHLIVKHCLMPYTQLRLN